MNVLKEDAQSLIRAALIFIGSWLIHKGYVSKDFDVQYFSSAAGLGLTGIAVVLAMVKNRMFHKKICGEGVDRGSGI